MDELISRKAAIDALTALENPASTAQHLSAIFDCEDIIKMLPAVSEYKHGKWIPVTMLYRVKKDGNGWPQTERYWEDATEPDEIDGMRCSECGSIYDFTEARNWCSECGADMRPERGKDAVD